MKAGRSVITVYREFGPSGVEFLVDVVRDESGEVRATAGETVEDPEWEAPSGGRYLDDEPPGPTVLVRMGEEIELDDDEECGAHDAIDEVLDMMQSDLRQLFSNLDPE